MKKNRMSVFLFSLSLSLGFSFGPGAGVSACYAAGPGPGLPASLEATTGDCGNPISHEAIIAGSTSRVFDRPDAARANLPGAENVLAEEPAAFSANPALAEEAEQAGQPVPLGDPFILLHEGTYYAYGTHSDRGIEVYTSDDLLTWTPRGLALDKRDAWGDRWFWAPEIYPLDGRFYMYYSADEHISVAVADHPAGPFRQTEKAPMLAEEKSIDNSLFIDDDGTPYLFFVRFNDGNNVWMAELEEDFVTLKKQTMRPVIHVSQPWEEVWPRVNEGPFVLKHKGLYYLTYSANSYESPLYGIGCATASSLKGEWTKYPENPLLQRPAGLWGTGHHALFTDKQGDLRIVFHAHRDSSHIHPRAMHIGRIGFENVRGVDRLRISSGYLTPRLASCPADKASTDKTSTDKAWADKASTDKASTDKTSTDKAWADKASTDKVRTDKASADKASAEAAAPASSGSASMPAAGSPVVSSAVSASPASAPAVYRNPVVPYSLPDPSVIGADDGYYYLYATEDIRNLPIHRSNDLVHWEQVATAFTDRSRPDFEPGAGIWAPDINRIGDRYVLYYSLSVWGGEWTCGIGCATSDRPEGPFKDEGMMMRSNQIGVQNSIDPFYIEEGGKKYLFWGSFRGIYGIRLTDDGLRVGEGEKPRRVAGTAYEGTYIHRRDGYYYLFASIGTCCEGLKSTYTTVVGRSKSLFGPYVDKAGRSMLENHHEILIGKNDAFVGTGHNSEIVTDKAGRDWFFYHAVDTERPQGRVLMLDRVDWVDGWPSVAGGTSSLEAGAPVF